MLDQMEPENFDTLSEVMEEGTPNWLIHPEKRALAQLMVDMSDNRETWPKISLSFARAT